MSAKKLWKVVRDGQTWRPKSKTEAYNLVHTEATDGFEHRLPIMEIYMDERDGQGWQLYEVINLRELPAWPNK